MQVGSGKQHAANACGGSPGDNLLAIASKL
jgi:hypothetical protein